MVQFKMQVSVSDLLFITPGVAISGNGLNWMRGNERVSGEKGEGASSDVGMVIEPNKDWWWFDTCHLQVSDVQVIEIPLSFSHWRFLSCEEFPSLLVGPSCLRSDSV